MKVALDRYLSLLNEGLCSSDILKEGENNLLQIDNYRNKITELRNKAIKHINITDHVVKEIKLPFPERNFSLAGVEGFLTHIQRVLPLDDKKEYSLLSSQRNNLKDHFLKVQKKGREIENKNLSVQDVVEIIKNIINDIKNNSQIIEELDDKKCELIAYLRELKYLQTGEFAYSSQILSVINEIICNKNSSFAEIQTGQGKTLISSIMSVMIYAEGKSVHVGTSDSHLADAGFKKNKEFMESLGIKSKVIDSNVLTLDINSLKDYKEPGIYYGDVPSLSLFKQRLSQEGEKLNNLELIADEADTLTTSSITYRYAGSLDDDSIFNSKIYYYINDYIDSQKFKDTLSKEKNIYELKNYLNNFVPESIITDDDLDRLMASAVLAKNVFDSTKQKWIESAGSGRGIVKRQGSDNLDAQLIINNNFASSAELKGGAQQLLHARLNVDKDISLLRNQHYQGSEFVIKREALVLSEQNGKDFLRSYDRVKGMSGTLVHEREFLSGRITKYPSYHNSKRLDGAVLVKDKQSSKSLILKTIRSKIKKGQPVLLVSKNSAEALELFEFLKNAIPKIDGLNNIQRFTASIRDADENTIIKNAGMNGYITITDSLGRGLDFKSDHANGLFVGMDFIGDAESSNQIRGRTARQGSPGEFLQIVRRDELDSSESLSHENLSEQIKLLWDKRKQSNLKARQVDDLRTKVLNFALDQILKDNIDLNSRKDKCSKFIILYNKKMQEKLKYYKETEELGKMFIEDIKQDFLDIAKKSFATLDISNFNIITNKLKTLDPEFASKLIKLKSFILQYFVDKLKNSSFNNYSHFVSICEKKCESLIIKYYEFNYSDDTLLHIIKEKLLEASLNEYNNLCDNKLTLELVKQEISFPDENLQEEFTEPEIDLLDENDYINKLESDELSRMDFIGRIVDNQKLLVRMQQDNKLNKDSLEMILSEKDFDIAIAMANKLRDNYLITRLNFIKEKLRPPGVDEIHVTLKESLSLIKQTYDLYFKEYSQTQDLIFSRKALIEFNKNLKLALPSMPGKSGEASKFTRVLNLVEVSPSLHKKILTNIKLIDTEKFKSLSYLIEEKSMAFNFETNILFNSDAEHKFSESLKEMFVDTDLNEKLFELLSIVITATKNTLNEDNENELSKILNRTYVDKETIKSSLISSLGEDFVRDSLAAAITLCAVNTEDLANALCPSVLGSFSRVINFQLTKLTIVRNSLSELNNSTSNVDSVPPIFEGIVKEGNEIYSKYKEDFDFRIDITAVANLLSIASSIKSTNNLNNENITSVFKMLEQKPRDMELIIEFKKFMDNVSFNKDMSVDERSIVNKIFLSSIINKFNKFILNKHELSLNCIENFINSLDSSIPENILKNDLVSSALNQELKNKIKYDIRVKINEYLIGSDSLDNIQAKDNLVTFLGLESNRIITPSEIDEIISTESRKHINLDFQKIVFLKKEEKPQNPERGTLYLQQDERSLNVNCLYIDSSGNNIKLEPINIYVLQKNNIYINDSLKLDKGDQSNLQIIKKFESLLGGGINQDRLESMPGLFKDSHEHIKKSTKEKLECSYQKMLFIKATKSKDYRFDTQGRVIADVKLEDVDYSDILESCGLQREGGKKKLESFIGPITDSTFCSIDVLGFTNSLNNKFEDWLLLDNNFLLTQALNAFIKSESRGSVIPIQTETELHMRLVSRVLEDHFGTDISVENWNSIRMKAAKKFNDGAMKEIFRDALVKSYNQNDGTLDIAKLNRILDSKRIELRKIIKIELVNEIKNKYPDKKDFNTIIAKIDKKEFEAKTAISFDYFHTNFANRSCVRTTGTENTAHNKRIGSNTAASKSLYSNKMIVTNEGLKVEQYTHNKIQVRVPSLAVLKDKQKFAKLDKNEQKKIQVLDVTRKLLDIKNNHFKDYDGPIVYNLLTSLYAPLRKKEDKKFSNQNYSAKIILRGVHEFNYIQAKSKGDFVYLQNIPVNGHGSSLNNSRGSIKEMKLMTEISLLITLQQNNQILSESMKVKLDFLLKTINSEYSKFLLSANREKNFKSYFHADFPKDIIDEMTKFRELLIDNKNYAQQNTILSNDVANENKTEKNFVDLAAKVLAKLLSSPDNAYSKLENGLFTQALSVYLEKASMSGCKSANERYALVAGREEMFKSLSLKSKDEMTVKEYDLFKALNDFANGKHLSHLIEKTDIVYNENHLYDAASANACIDSGGPSKIKITRSDIVSKLKNVNTNVVENHKTVTYLASEHCGKLQAHKSKEEDIKILSSLFKEVEKEKKYQIKSGQKTKPVEQAGVELADFKSTSDLNKNPGPEPEKEQIETDQPTIELTKINTQSKLDLKEKLKYEPEKEQIHTAQSGVELTEKSEKSKIEPIITATFAPVEVAPDLADSSMLNSSRSIPKTNDSSFLSPPIVEQPESGRASNSGMFNNSRSRPISYNFAPNEVAVLSSNKKTIHFNTKVVNEDSDKSQNKKVSSEGDGKFNLSMCKNQRDKDQYIKAHIRSVINHSDLKNLAVKDIKINLNDVSNDLLPLYVLHCKGFGVQFECNHQYTDNNKKIPKQYHRESKKSVNNPFSLSIKDKIGSFFQPKDKSSEIDSIIQKKIDMINGFLEVSPDIFDPNTIKSDITALKRLSLRCTDMDLKGQAASCINEFNSLLENHSSKPTQKRGP
ncbi:hypothetical protein N9L02_02410 [Gammaproteobacteria bacterium]|nr:hypothetical protein [Gammaproteobacteria bacterium]